MSNFVAIGGILDTIKEAGSSGDTKARLSLLQLIILAAMAGVYLAFATAFAIGVAASVHAPSLQKLLMGAVFPVGLIAIVIGGAELFTGNAMVVPIAAMVNRIGWAAVVYNWVGTYLGNFIGSFFIALMFTQGAHVLVGPGFGQDWTDLLHKVVVTKTSLSFSEAFWRGFACVWLVDLSVWLAYRVKDAMAKFALVWFPAFAFFALGLEHSVVNMYLIPSGMLSGAPITWNTFLINNLLPVTLGNTVAGVFSMALAYWLSAGMPVLKGSTEAGEYDSANLALLSKTVGFSVGTTVAFVALLPGLPALLVYLFSQGWPAEGSAVTMTPEAASALIVVLLYLALLTFAVCRLRPKWHERTSEPVCIRLRANRSTIKRP